MNSSRPEKTDYEGLGQQREMPEKLIAPKDTNTMLSIAAGLRLAHDLFTGHARNAMPNLNDNGELT